MVDRDVPILARCSHEPIARPLSDMTDDMDAAPSGEAPLTADCESEKGGFATIDYGDGSEPPALYVGRELPFDALHLGGLPAEAEVRQPRPSGEKLKCPNCGAPLSLRLPEQSVRVVCQNCNHLLDASQGAFRVLGALANRGPVRG